VKAVALIRDRTYNGFLVDNVHTTVVVLVKEPRGKTGDNGRRDEDHQMVRKCDISQGSVFQIGKHFDEIIGWCVVSKR
jgi:hypothetical protein